MTEQAGVPFEADSTRLFLQHRYVTSALGGLVSEQIPMGSVKNVLDIICGTGAWALDLSKRYPHIHVTGIDPSHSSLSYAQSHARLSGINTVSFEHMDLSTTLAFNNATFDYIHLRTIAPFAPPSIWTLLIPKIVRVLKPGGWLEMVVFEQGATSSKGYNTINALAMKSLHASNLSLAPDLCI